MTAAGENRDVVRTAIELLRQLGLWRTLLAGPRLLRAVREARLTGVSSP